MHIRLPICQSNASHPTRGEWIEMSVGLTAGNAVTGLTPHGVSGLKSRYGAALVEVDVVSPHTG